MDVDVVQSWPSSKLADWRAYFALQQADRENPEVDDDAIKEKLARHLKPKPRD